MARNILPGYGALEMNFQEIQNGLNAIPIYAPSSTTDQTSSPSVVAYSKGDQIIYAETVTDADTGLVTSITSRKLYTFNQNVTNAQNTGFAAIMTLGAVTEAGTGAGGIPVVTAFPSSPSRGDQIFLDVAISASDGTNNRPRGFYTYIQPNSNPNSRFWEEVSIPEVGELYNNARIGDIIFLSAEEEDFNGAGNDFNPGFYRASANGASPNFNTTWTAIGGEGGSGVIVGDNLGANEVLTIPADNWLILPNSVKHYLYYNHTGSTFTITAPSTGYTLAQIADFLASDGTLTLINEDLNELSARVVISGINVNQVAGTPTETLLTFASAQEAAEFAATNGIVAGALASAVTFTLTHDGDAYNYNIPSGGTPARAAVISGNTIAFQPQAPNIVEVHGATAIVDHTFDHLDSGNLTQLTFVDADTARYDVESETVLTDSDAVLPTSGAVHDYVEGKFFREGTPAVQYWEVDGVPNGGPTFTGSGETVAEVLEFSDFRTDDSFRPVFGVDNAPIVDTIAFSINNVGDAATTVNNGDWTVAIENKYKVIFTKNGQTVIKTLLRGDGSASVVSTDLLCLAFDPMKIPGDNSRAGEKIYIGTENETVLVLDLNEIDFNGDGTITVAVAKYGLRGSLTPSSEQINITALGVHYRKVEHLSVVRWIQTVVFGTSIGSLPWISAEVGEGGNFTNFLDLENAENEGGTTGNIYQSSNDQNNTYETQRGYTLDGGVPFEFSHAAVRSITWNADADGGITMIAVGNSILRPSQDQSFAEGRVPLFAVGQYWGIPMGPLAAQYLGSDTPTNRQTLFSNLEFSPLTYLGVVSGGISDANSTYPGGFKTNFLHNQLDTKAGINIDDDLNVIHLSDIVYQEGTGAGFYMVGQRLASDSDYHGIGLFVDFQEFSLVTYNRDNTYLRFEKGLTNERASRVKIIDNLTKLGDNDNSPYHKLYFRNNTGDASDRNIIAFGNNRQALEVNTTVTTGSAAFALSTIDQFEELVNSNDGPFFASSDNFWGGFIPNKNDFSKTTVLWGTRSSVDVASSIFNAFRVQQEIVEIKFFDHSSPTAGPTLSIPKTNGEDIRSFAEKFAAHFGSGQTFPNGTATLIPATDPNVSESAITVEFDPDTTKADDFTITVHVNNFSLLQPVGANQTQYSLPITESFELEVVSGTTDLILGYQLAVPSFDGLPNFDFSVTVGGQDARSGATLVNGLLELNATTVAGLTTPGAEGSIVTVNYLQASDEFYDFNEDLATIISYIDPYSGTNTIRGSFKISLDHTFNNENELAAFLVSELEASGLLTDSVEARVIGTELIFEIGLNSKGPILHENQKISITVTNPVLDPVNADPLTITRRLNGDTDETGSESGPIDLREVPSRDEMIDFIESAVEELGTNEGIGNLDVIDSTGVPFKIDALDEEVLLENDPLTTKSYVDNVIPETGSINVATGHTNDEVTIQSNGVNTPLNAVGNDATPGVDEWFATLGGLVTSLPPLAQGSLISFGSANGPSTANYALVRDPDVVGNITTLRFSGSLPSTVQNQFNLQTAPIPVPVVLYNVDLVTQAVVSDTVIFNSDDFVVETDATDDGHAHVSLAADIAIHGEVAAASLWQEGFRNDYPGQAVVFDNIAAAAGSRRDFTRTGTSINANVATDGVSKPGDNTYTLIDLPADNPLSAFNGLLVDPNFEWVARFYVDIIWRDNTQYYEGDTVQYTGAFGYTRRAYCEAPHISTEENSPFVIGNVEYDYRTTGFNANTPWSPVEASVDIATGTTGEGITPYLNTNGNTGSTILRNIRVWDSYLAHGEHAGQFAIVLGTGTTTVQPANIDSGNQPSPGDRFHFSDGIFAPSNAPEYELVGIDLIEGLDTTTYNIDVEITADAEFNNAATTRAIATNGFGRLSAGDTAVINVPGILNPVTFTVINVDETDDTIDLQPNNGTEFTLPARVYTFVQDTTFAGENYTTFFFELPEGVLRVPEDISINDFFSVSDTRTDLGHTNRFVFRDDHFTVNKEGVGESFIEIAPGFSGITVDRVNNGAFMASTNLASTGTERLFNFQSGGQFVQFLTDIGFPTGDQSYRLGNTVILNIATDDPSSFIISADAIYTYNSGTGSVLSISTADITTVLDGSTGNTDFGALTFEIQEYQFNSITAGSGIRFDHSVGGDDLTISYNGGDTGGFTNGQDVRLGANSTIGGTVASDTGEVAILGDADDVAVQGDWIFNGDAGIGVNNISSALGAGNGIINLTSSVLFPGQGLTVGGPALENFVNGYTRVTLGVALNANNFRTIQGAGITIDDVSTPGFSEFSVNRIVGDGFISIANDRDAIMKAGPVESYTTFLAAVTDTDIDIEDRPGEVMTFQNITGTPGNGMFSLLNGGAVTNQFNLVDEIKVNQAGNDPNYIINRAGVGDNIIVVHDADNWAIFTVTGNTLSGRSVNLTNSFGALTTAGVNVGETALIATSTADYDVTNILRYVDVDNALNNEGIYELLSAGIDSTDEAGIVTNHSLNNGSTNAMAYLALQFNASVPVEITADNQSDSTTNYFGTTISAVLNGTVLTDDDFRDNVYLFYQTTWNRALTILIDIITPAGAQTETVTRVATINGAIVPQV